MSKTSLGLAVITKTWTTEKGVRNRVATLTCHCGKKYEVYWSRIKYGAGKNCSLECRSKNPEYRKKMASIDLSKRDISGSKNPNWRGGLTSGRNKLQSSKQYKDWRKAVYERDGYKCVECGVLGDGKNLNADHIKPYALYPELVFNMDNGRTLCVDCHKETNTYGWKLFNDIKWRNKCRV